MKSKKPKRRVRKKYSYIERALLLLPKLSTAECRLLQDATLLPTPEHIQYIRQGLESGLMRSHYRTIYPDLPVKIVEEPLQGYGRWVGSKWRAFSKKKIKKYQIPMTISDKPIPT